mgnify:CR=1 FL=1
MRSIVVRLDAVLARHGRTRLAVRRHEVVKARGLEQEQGDEGHEQHRVGGARQSSMAGIPSIASSYCAHDTLDVGISAKLTAEICNNLWSRKNYSDELEKSFFIGGLFLNLNFPKDCNSIFKYGTLGIRDYKKNLKEKRILT